MDKSLKEKIIDLRKENKSYNEISELLVCSKSTISVYCKNEDLNDIGLCNMKISDVSLKEKIIELRIENKTYNEISKILGCSKAIISIYCKKENLNNTILSETKITETKINEIKEYYKTHTLKETSKYYGIKSTTLKYYVSKKRKILTEIEKKHDNYERIKVHRQKIKEVAVEYKGGKCEKCGYDKCIWAFEFHHMNPLEKEFTLSKYQSFSWDKVKKELDKCILVCSNCHRELHFDEYVNKKDK